MPWSYFCENGNRSGILTVAAGATPGKTWNLARLSNFGEWWSVNVDVVLPNPGRRRGGDGASAAPSEDWLTTAAENPVLVPQSGPYRRRTWSTSSRWCGAMTLTKPPPGRFRTLPSPQSMVGSTGHCGEPMSATRNRAIRQQQADGPRTVVESLGDRCHQSSRGRQGSDPAAAQATPIGLNTAEEFPPRLRAMDRGNVNCRETSLRRISEQTPRGYPAPIRRASFGSRSTEQPCTPRFAVPARRCC